MNSLNTINKSKRLLGWKQIMTQLYAACNKITFNMEVNT